MTDGELTDIARCPCCQRRMMKVKFSAAVDTRCRHCGVRVRIDRRMGEDGLVRLTVVPAPATLADSLL